MGRLHKTFVDYGFLTLHRLLCAERTQRDGGNFVPAQVRMFKDERTLRLWTSCPDQPLQESTSTSGTMPQLHPLTCISVNLTFDKIVPLYAWTDNSNAGAEIYLRHRGQQLGFCYKFDVHNEETGKCSSLPSPTFNANIGKELYGFQGALMESYFEGEYQYNTPCTRPSYIRYAVEAC